MRYGCGLLVALMCACGGGGTVPANGGPNPSQQLAQQMLESCRATFYGDFLQVLAIVEGLLDPAETNPQQFTIDFVDTDTAQVLWNLDLGGEPAPELLGALLFAKPDGSPETAADVSLLAGGFDDLDAMLASLPDGTQVTFVISGILPPPILDINLVFEILGGAVDSVSAIALTEDAECLINLEFTDVSFQNVGGDYPNLTANLTVRTTDAALVGTIAFNGTSQARIEVSLDGEVHAFNLDLETGVATPA